MSPSIHIVYASTSGHTEFVVQRAAEVLQKQGLEVEVQRAEKAGPADLVRGDVLILASSTWNTGSVEGQLNPHMFMLLMDRAAKADLRGKTTTYISLGDERYKYTARSKEHLEHFIQSHNGTLIGQPLVIINEPYDQVKKIEDWALEFSKEIAKK